MVLQQVVQLEGAAALATKAKALSAPQRVIKPPFVQCGKLDRLLYHIQQCTTTQNLEAAFERHASPSAAKTAQL